MAETGHSTAGATRFADLRPLHALLIMLGVVGLIAIGLMQPPPSAAAPQKAPVKIVGSDRPADPAGDDILLYRVIVDKVRAGQPYHAATARLLRDNSYPLKPFVTFRLPTLAFILAAIPEWLGPVLLGLLAAAVILAWTVRLGTLRASERVTMYGSLLLLAGCVTAGSPSLSVFHESWSALLIALSLALWRADRWWPSVLIALLAVMIRELALPFLLLMGASALWRRNWTEATCWAVAVALFGGALAIHAQLVAAVVLPTDPASPSWAAAGGWPFVVSSVRGATMLGFAPLVVTAFALPVALLGWLSRREAHAIIAGLFLTGFATMMMLFGRPNNFYWAMMMVPMLLPGLALAPAAIADLRASLRRDMARAPA